VLHDDKFVFAGCFVIQNLVCHFADRIKCGISKYHYGRLVHFLTFHAATVLRQLGPVHSGPQ
jgi:hypothetical protein